MSQLSDEKHQSKDLVQKILDVLGPGVSHRFNAALCLRIIRLSQILTSCYDLMEIQPKPVLEHVINQSSLELSCHHLFK